MPTSPAARLELHRFPLAIAALAAVLGSLLLTGSVAHAAPPNSASRIVMWTRCDDLPKMTDADLNAWQSKGVAGFVCSAGWMRGMGGTQSFTGDPTAASGQSYELERALRDSRVVDRMRARGIKAYLGVYLVNYWNKSTPLVDWFNDSGWSGTVIPQLTD